MAASVNSGFSSMRFPDYLGTDEAPAYIRFEPIEMDFGKFKNTAPTGASIITGTEDSAKNAVYDKLAGNKLDKLKQDFTKKAAGLLSGKLNIGGLSLDFSKDKDLFNTQGSINLYLPEGIGANLGLQYDGGASGAGAARAGAGIVGDILDGKTVKASLLDAGAQAMTGTISSVIANIASNPGARVLSGIGAGVVANNVTFQLFKGVSYRSFSYQFNLMAKNPKEAQEIKRICDAFTWYSLPSRDFADVNIDDGKKGIFHFYDIPAMWKIDYMYKDAKMEYHQAPNTYCVLSNIDVQYPSNKLYSDGAPLQVSLTLSFTEIEPMYRNSDPGDNSSGAKELNEQVASINVNGGAKQIGPKIPGVNGGFN